MKKIKFYITEKAFSVIIDNITVQGSGASVIDTARKMSLIIGTLARIYDGSVIKEGKWVISLFNKNWIGLDYKKYIEYSIKSLYVCVEKEKEFKMLSEDALMWNIKKRLEGNLDLSELGLCG